MSCEGAGMYGADPIGIHGAPRASRWSENGGIFVSAEIGQGPWSHQVATNLGIGLRSIDLRGRHHWFVGEAPFTRQEIGHVWMVCIEA